MTKRQFSFALFNEFVAQYDHYAGRGAGFQIHLAWATWKQIVEPHLTEEEENGLQTLVGLLA